MIGGDGSPPPPGDLANNILLATAEKVSGKTPSPATINLFSSVDDTAHIYTRNAGLWASGIDLSCVPAYSSGGGASANGVLVAPDILIQAAHDHPSGTFYFCSADNQVFSADVVGGQQIGSTDLWVSRLSAQMPASIKPAKVLPISAYTGGSVKFIQIGRASCRERV